MKVHDALKIQDMTGTQEVSAPQGQETIKDCSDPATSESSTSEAIKLHANTEYYKNILFLEHCAVPIVGTMHLMRLLCDIKCNKKPELYDACLSAGGKFSRIISKALYRYDGRHLSEKAMVLKLVAKLTRARLPDKTMAPIHNAYETAYKEIQTSFGVKNPDCRI